MDTLQDVIRRAIEDPARKIDLRLLARDLGVGYRSLMYWIGGGEDRRFPAELVPRLCRLLQNYDALDLLEREAGRLAFRIPEPEAAEYSDTVNVHRLLREVSEAVGSLCSTLEDGRVEDREAQATISEVDDVIRHCAFLRYWLLQRADPKRGAAKPAFRPARQTSD